MLMFVNIWFKSNFLFEKLTSKHQSTIFFSYVTTYGVVLVITLQFKESTLAPKYVLRRVRESDEKTGHCLQPVRTHPRHRIGWEKMLNKMLELTK